MKLPIEIVPNTTPRRFKWQQRVDTINGVRTIDYEEVLRPALEAAMVDLLELATKISEREQSLIKELNEMKKTCEDLTKQLFAAKKAKG